MITAIIARTSAPETANDSGHTLICRDQRKQLGGIGKVSPHAGGALCIGLGPLQDRCCITLQPVDIVVETTCRSCSRGLKKAEIVINAQDSRFYSFN